MEESTDWQHYVEFWRCYRSGQFISYVALLGEWRDRSKLWPPEPEWKAGRLLYAEDAVMSILEFLMFSSRWAAELGDGFGVDLRIEVRNTAGRRLGLGSSPGTVAMGGEAHAPDWKWTAMASFAELVADRRQLAADAALDLFSQFDWDAPADVIRAIQDKYAGTS